MKSDVPRPLNEASNHLAATANEPEDPTSPPAPHLIDRASPWFIAVIFALTTAMSLQALVWLGWPPPDEFDRRSTWQILHAITSFAGNLDWMRHILYAGAATVALTTLGVFLRHAWGFALALPVSMALISLISIARYLAISQEPRQFVARSTYVQAATELFAMILLAHGVTAFLSLRRLHRDPAASELPLRAAMILLAAILALDPYLWIREGASSGAINAVITCAAIAALLATLVAAVRLTRTTALVGFGAALAVLLVHAISITILLFQRPRRGHLYSEAAEQGLHQLSLAVPALLALAGIFFVLRQHLAQRRSNPSIPSSASGESSSSAA